MSIRGEIIWAIGELSAKERSQLLLYLLEDYSRALETIDEGKWRFHEASEPSELVPEAAAPGVVFELYPCGSSGCTGHRSPKRRCLARGNENWTTAQMTRQVEFLEPPAG